MASFHNGGIGKRDGRHSDGEHPTYSVGESNTVFLMTYAELSATAVVSAQTKIEKEYSQNLSLFCSYYLSMQRDLAPNVP